MIGLEMRLLLILVAIVHVRAYNCTTGIMFVKYQGEPYFFPSGDVDDHVDANQQCIWEIQIPPGYYVKWGYVCKKTGFYTDYNTFDMMQASFAKRSSPGVVVSVVNNNTLGLYNDSQEITGDELDIYFFSSRITTGQFHFNITWYKMEPPMSPIVYNIEEFGYKIINLTDLNTNNVVTFAAPSKQQIALFGDCDSLSGYNSPEINCVWIYYGYSVNGDYHQILAEGYYTDGIMRSNAFTLYSGIPNAELESCSMTATDRRNIDQFSKWSSVAVPNTKSTVFSMITYSAVGACSKPSAVTVYSVTDEPLILLKLEINNNDYMAVNPVQAYLGIPSPSGINQPVVTFRLEDLQSQIPYFFNSSVVTFVLNAHGNYSTANVYVKTKDGNVDEQTMKQRTSGAWC